MPVHKKSLNINLLVKEDFGESFSDQLLSWVLTYGRYIIIITQIVVLTVFFLRFKIDREHTDYKELVAQKQTIIESMSEVEADIRKTQAKLANIRKITNGQNIFINLIQYLQTNTPSDTIFSSLTMNSDKLSFNATAQNLKSFSYLLSEFQRSNKFLDVTLENIFRRPDGRVEFKINAKLNAKELY